MDSLESAINAYQGGADRVELCSSLNEGGLTPSLGLYKSIRKYLHQHDPDGRFKINCMIRCRSGDFLYSDTEMDTMSEEVRQFVEIAGDVDGLVFGALDPEGHVDEAAVRQLMQLSRGVEFTFHRAYDVCADWEKCFRQIESLGCRRLLSSGQKASAYEGRDLLAKLVDFDSNVIIMAGAGVNSQNLEAILSSTRCKEFHASCSIKRESRMVYRNSQVRMGAADEEFQIRYTDTVKVKELKNIYNRFYLK